MSFRRAGCLAVLAVACVLLFTAGSAESITIRPAEFDHVTADVPEEVMAGVEFEVSVTFVDRYGNPMGENWKPDTSLTLHISQPASVRPSILTPENYVPGFSYSVHTEKMGELTLSLRDARGKVLEQWDLTIKSGRPVELRVDLPARAEVGQTVDMSVQAVDSHGNIAFGYEPDADSLVLEDGVASVTGDIRSRAGGVYEVPVTFKAHGQRTVTLRDRKRALTGTSAPVNVSPAPLGSFNLKVASDQSTAGDDISLTITALDRYGNLVTDYDSRYKGVRLYSSNAAIAPDLVAPSSFSGGVARVSVVMRSAGEHSVSVSELQSNISGDFNVRILPATVSTFSVRTPDSATAGEPFEISIVAEDRFGNRTQEMPKGSRIRLESTGTGVLVPDVVGTDVFKDGSAKVKVSYEKAESFEIKASLGGQGLVSVVAPPVNKKEEARLSATRAREEAMRARRESRLREKRVTDRVSRSKRSKPEVPTAPEPAPVVRKTPEPVPAKKPAPVKSPESAARKTPVKKADVSPPVVASKKVLRPGVLDGIGVAEQGSKAFVTFSTNGMTNYNVTTSAKLSRKWIDIEFPDMAVDLPDRISGGEKIVGEVYVEPLVDDGPGVRVSVEILPTRIGYDVYQEGQSIVLKVNRQ